MPQLVYLVYREALSSVFTSQVLIPLEKHRGLAGVTLGLLAPLGHLLRPTHRPAVRRITDRSVNSGLELKWLPSPPARLPRLWPERAVLRYWLASRFPRDEPIIVRCRGSRMTCLALDAVRGRDRARVIYDCRGAEVSEAIQMVGLDSRPADKWSESERRSIEGVLRAEQRAVEGSAGVTCVSHAMVDSLRSRWPATARDKFFVVPCCPSTESFAREIPQRSEARRQLGLAGKFVVTYLGSLVWYQMPEESLRIFRLIRELRPDAHFLAITTDRERMRVLVQNAGLAPTEVTIRSFPAQEVPRWLVASDLGLMLRDSTETNRVASPVKFGEYMAAGVPVVVSQNLGDCTALVERHRLGVAVDIAQSDAQIRQALEDGLAQDMSDSAFRCHEFAARELSWSHHVPALVDWYRHLMTGPAPSSAIPEGR